MEDSILKIPILPVELVTEILSRLPVKTLLTFRSVSKSWLALISSLEFIKNHLRISANNKDYAQHRLLLRYKCILKDCYLRSLFCNSVMEVSRLDCPVTDQHKTFWSVVGSVNGLICLTGGEKALCIWNPSIRKYKTFPDFITNWMVRIVYGFGYDEFNDDYKVVRCAYNYGDWPRFDIKVYSLKDDSWRSIRYRPPNGMRFWGSADEKLEKVEQPCCEKEGVLVLGVLGNNLSVISKDNHLRTHIDVWVMKEYKVKES
ncbi:F-box/kelch-repeat protein like [Capsicum galapagoense]